MKKLVLLAALTLVALFLAGQALATTPDGEGQSARLRPAAVPLTTPSYYDDFGDPLSGWGSEAGVGYARGYVNGEYRIWLEDVNLEWPVIDGGPMVDGDFQAQV